MSEDYQITAVDGCKEWTGQHGLMVDYYIHLDDYPERVVLTQKPDTPAPGVHKLIYGHIEVLDRKTKAGEDFQIHKLKKDQRDPSLPLMSSSGQGQNARTGTDSPVRANSGASFDSRGARIERQAAWKVTAQILSHQNGQSDEYEPAFKGWLAYLSEDLDAYEAKRFRVTDAPGGDAQATGNGAGGEKSPAPEPDLAGRAALMPTDRVRLELVTCGALDITDIPKAIAGLDAAQTKKFELALDNIAAEVDQPSTTGSGIAGGMSDDDDIPFALVW